MTACIQPVAMFGSELRWKGDQIRGTIERSNWLQLLVNHKGRATTGCFLTTNLAALSMESGLRPVAAQLENRLRRFGLRLFSLPQGDQTREVAGKRPLDNGPKTPSDTRGGWTAQSCWRNQKPSTRNWCRERRPKPKRSHGLTMFTDGSRLDRAAGYPVVWQSGHDQEAYNAECAALARALETASRRQDDPGGGHDLHGRPGRDQADGLGGARP